MVQPAAPLRAQLLPDLVIKDIRRDGLSGVRVLIANDGAADEAQTFMVDASAHYRSRRGYARLTPAGPIKAGESEWVSFAAFYPDGESSYPGKPDTKLTEWETVSVSVDVFVAAPWGADPLASLDPARRSKCTAERGCVVEADEKNNNMSVPVATMAEAAAD
jgi:hypothetical protein